MSHHSHLPPEVDEKIRSFLRRHRRGLRWGLLAAGLLAVVLVLAATWAVYRGAAHLKDWAAGKAPVIRLPLAWEKPLGDAALAQLRSQFQFSTNRQVLAALNGLATPLFAGLTNSDDRFTLLVTESREVNALALPGGHIVFHRGLLERARTAEEVQGVLAHEMAHIQKRHSVLQLAQNIGLDLLLQQVLGGEGQILDALVRDSGKLLGLKFSRDHERAADDLGWESMERAGLNPQGMLSFFAGLNEMSKASTGPAIPWLSTHPAPQERMERLRQKGEALGPREFRSFNKEFKDLQAALGLTLERP
jgi:predicted Zn-dependent protease